MRAVCPNNKDHKEFLTTAYVMQEWVVDEEGAFIECEYDCVEVTGAPDSDSTWTCKICGAIAIVTD